MRNLFFSMLAFLALVFYVRATDDGKAHQKYLPDALGNVYLGMTEEELLEDREGVIQDMRQSTGSRKVYREQNPGGSIREVVYCINPDGATPLYEVVIDYNTAAARDRDAEKLLGKPNAGAKWFLTPSKKASFPINAWKYENKLLVAGMMSGTEWEEAGE